jgi:lipid-A-disaccharide synthase-like uncharacterized protein
MDKFLLFKPAIIFFIIVCFIQFLAIRGGKKNIITTSIYYFSIVMLLMASGYTITQFTDNKVHLIISYIIILPLAGMLTAFIEKYGKKQNENKTV